MVKKYIRGTEKKAIVQFVAIFLCHLKNDLVKGAVLPCRKVYINTRVLKHAYDKRTAEEFDFLISNLNDIVKYPDLVYKNKNGKRGEFCLVREMKDKKYFCSIQFNNESEESLIAFDIATFFRTEDSYIKSYELLWEWKDGVPSS